MATVAENLQTIIDIKADIKTAIENKGVTVGDASFSEYAGKIDSIEGSGSTSDIILPKYVKIAYSGYEHSAEWEWPSNIKFAQTNIWRYTFSHITYVKNLPAISTLHPTDLYYKTDFSHMFEFAHFNISNNIDFWNSLDYSNTNYINDMFSGATIEDFESFTCNSTILKDISYLFFGYHNSTNDFPSVYFTDLSTVTDVYYAFYPYALYNIEALRLPNLGQGFVGVSNYDHKLNLSRLNFNNISALVTTFNDLSTVTVTDAIITLNANTYALLSADDIAIATNKGWVVESA